MNPSTSASQPSALSEKLLELFENENRPFAFNEIHERIGKQHSKQAIQKSIESQVSRNQIIEKTYGKQKIYCVNNKSTSKQEVMIHAIHRILYWFGFVSLRSWKSTWKQRTIRFINIQNQMPSCWSAVEQLNRSWREIPTKFPFLFSKRNSSNWPRA